VHRCSRGCRPVPTRRRRAPSRGIPRRQVHKPDTRVLPVLSRAIPLRRVRTRGIRQCLARSQVIPVLSRAIPLRRAPMRATRGLPVLSRGIPLERSARRFLRGPPGRRSRSSDPPRALRIRIRRDRRRLGRLLRPRFLEWPRGLRDRRSLLARHSLLEWRGPPLHPCRQPLSLVARRCPGRDTPPLGCRPFRFRLRRPPPWRVPYRPHGRRPRACPPYSQRGCPRRQCLTPLRALPPARCSLG